MAVKAADELDLVASSDPEDARGSIAIGLKYSAAGQWEQAQEYFERALELPGTGLKRWRDKPPALSAGELQAALYNVACCRSRLGDVENGLIAIAGAVEQGALRRRAGGGGGAHCRHARRLAASCRH
jgi:tetratricopeptide (TPR) repeat protein